MSHHATLAHSLEERRKRKKDTSESKSNLPAQLIRFEPIIFLIWTRKGNRCDPNERKGRQRRQCRSREPFFILLSFECTQPSRSTLYRHQVIHTQTVADVLAHVGAAEAICEEINDAIFKTLISLCSNGSHGTDRLGLRVEATSTCIVGAGGISICRTSSDGCCLSPNSTSAPHYPYTLHPSLIY